MKLIKQSVGYFQQFALQRRCFCGFLGFETGQRLLEQAKRNQCEDKFNHEQKLWAEVFHAVADRCDEDSFSKRSPQHEVRRVLRSTLNSIIMRQGQEKAVKIRQDKSRRNSRKYTQKPIVTLILQKQAYKGGTHSQKKGNFDQICYRFRKPHPNQSRQTVHYPKEETIGSRRVTLRHAHLNRVGRQPTCQPKFFNYIHAEQPADQQLASTTQLSLRLLSLLLLLAVPRESSEMKGDEYRHIEHNIEKEEVPLEDNDQSRPKHSSSPKQEANNHHQHRRFLLRVILEDDGRNGDVVDHIGRINNEETNRQTHIAPIRKQYKQSHNGYQHHPAKNVTEGVAADHPFGPETPHDVG